MSQTTAAFTRSILGPLTTTFTPPPACTIAVANCNTCKVGWLAQTCFSSNSLFQNASDESTCWPPVTITPTPGNLSSYGFYSPGLICPSGYSTACAAAGTAKTAVTGLANGTGFAFQYDLLANETAVGCCPTGFYCLPHWAQTCLSLAFSGVFPAVTCDGTTSNGFSFWTMPFTAPPASANGSSITVSTFSIYAPLIQINWQASDRPVSNTANTTTVSSTTIPSTTTSSAQQSSPRLAISAEIAISVVVPVVVIFLSLFLFFFIRRYRDKHYNKPNNDNNMQNPTPQVNELPTDDPVQEVP